MLATRLFLQCPRHHQRQDNDQHRNTEVHQEIAERVEQCVALPGADDGIREPDGPNQVEREHPDTDEHDAAQPAARSSRLLLNRRLFIPRRLASLRATGVIGGVNSIRAPLARRLDERGHTADATGDPWAKQQRNEQNKQRQSNPHTQRFWIGGDLRCHRGCEDHCETAEYHANTLAHHTLLHSHVLPQWLVSAHILCSRDYSKSHPTSGTRPPSQV